jgi:hypothetical protein
VSRADSALDEEIAGDVRHAPMPRSVPEADWFVAVKRVEQQDIQWLLSEYDLIVPQGIDQTSSAV